MAGEPLLQAAQAPLNRRFIEAWLRWRGRELLPSRRTLELADVKPLLSNIVLLEVQSTEEIPVRLAGPGLRDYLGFDLTGADYLALAPPQDRATRYYRMRQMADLPCGGWMRYEQRLVTGEVMFSEVVSLPIASDTPGLPRLVISNVVPLARPPSSVEAPAERVLDLADDFRFLDIGAGVPDGIAP